MSEEAKKHDRTITRWRDSEDTVDRRGHHSSKHKHTRSMDERNSNTLFSYAQERALSTEDDERETRRAKYT